MDDVSNVQSSHLPTDSSFLQNSNTCYGLGTLERPKIKFYFTCGSPEFGTGDGLPPQLGVRPSFQVKGKEVFCRLCATKVDSALAMVLHWQWEMEQQGHILEEIMGELQIPHAEVKHVVKKE